MLHGVCAPELSGLDSPVFRVKTVFSSDLKGLAAFFNIGVYEQFSNPNLTEHHSMATFRSDELTDPRNIDDHEKNIPETGAFIQLAWMWSNLSINPNSDSLLLRYLDEVGFSENLDSFVTFGWIYVQDPSDDDAIKSSAQEWVDTQASKVVTLNTYLNTLSDEEFSKADQTVLNSINNVITKPL